MSKQKTPKFDDKLLDELLKNYAKPEDMLGKDGIFKALQKALLERILNAELTENLWYERDDPAGNNSGNSRNGYSEKTLKGEHGDLTFNVPRDRNGEFEPKMISKNQTRFDGFDEKIISLYGQRVFPTDEAALKQLYLALKNISRKWTMPIQNWKDAMNCFMIMFEDRLSGLI